MSGGDKEINTIGDRGDMYIEERGTMGRTVMIREGKRQNGKKRRKRGQQNRNTSQWDNTKSIITCNSTMTIQQSV